VLEESEAPSLLECPEGGRHSFDQMDTDDGVEYGHCVKCGHWIDTRTGENETKNFEEEED
jgi:Zn ribbon nucleic-acid-binding protein